MNFAQKAVPMAGQESQGWYVGGLWYAGLFSAARELAASLLNKGFNVLYISPEKYDTPSSFLADFGVAPDYLSHFDQRVTSQTSFEVIEQYAEDTKNLAILYIEDGLVGYQKKRALKESELLFHLDFFKRLRSFSSLFTAHFVPSPQMPLEQPSTEYHKTGHVPLFAYTDRLFSLRESGYVEETEEAHQLVSWKPTLPTSPGYAPFILQAGCPAYPGVTAFRGVTESSDVVVASMLLTLMLKGSKVAVVAENLDDPSGLRRDFWDDFMGDASCFECGDYYETYPEWMKDADEFDIVLFLQDSPHLTAKQEENFLSRVTTFLTGKTVDVFVSFPKFPHFSTSLVDQQVWFH